MEEGGAVEDLEVGNPAWWAQRRVLVTGATGIVGSWVVKALLKRGAYVVGLVLDMDEHSDLCRSGVIKRVHVVNGNIEDFRTVERAVIMHECDSIIHLAAQAIVGVGQRSPLATFETNVRGTWNILEVCRLHADLIKRAVVASSDKAYGDQEQLPYTEDMPLLGKQPYEASKTCADIVTQSYYDAYRLPVAIARCGNIYGGGDLNWSRIVPGTIKSYFHGQSPVIRSDGQFIRDYIYVEDVANAYITLLRAIDEKQAAGHAFNFSSESRVRVLDIVDAIAEIMKCTDMEPRILNIARGEIRNQYLSAEKAHKLLNWYPRFSLRQGLEATVEWYAAAFVDMGLARNISKMGAR